MAKSMVNSQAKTDARASKPRKAATATKTRRNGKPQNAKPSAAADEASDLEDWRGETLARVRELILQADPEITEDVKWKKPSNPAGVPVWSHAGIICTGETYKQVVKLTFPRGASIKDPKRLLNSSLDGNTRRAIDIREGEMPDAKAFTALIQSAVAENLRLKEPKAKAQPKAIASSKTLPKTKALLTKTAPTRTQPTKALPAKSAVPLLSGGNPQIAKADGDAPVQAYIAAMPGWKREFGERLDSLIVDTVPKVRKAVKWNSPFYGVEGQGWFLSFHVFTRYVKVTFFAGTSLRPVPSGGTPKSKNARWIDIHEDDELDEAQMAAWIKQAAAIPGWMA